MAVVGGEEIWWKKKLNHSVNSTTESAENFLNYSLRDRW